MGYSNDRLELLVARFYGYKLFHVVLSAEPTDEVMEAVLGDDTLEAAEVLAESTHTNGEATRERKSITGAMNLAALSDTLSPMRLGTSSPKIKVR